MLDCSGQGCRGGNVGLFRTRVYRGKCWIVQAKGVEETMLDCSGQGCRGESVGLFILQVLMVTTHRRL
jgi:hypothetical protein